MQIASELSESRKHDLIMAISHEPSRVFRAMVQLSRMTGNVPFLMEDVVLLAVSLYLLRRDVIRLTRQ